MKKNLIIAIACCVVLALLFVIGARKDIVKVVLDTNSINWNNFTDNELSVFMEKNSATMENDSSIFYKCKFLDYDAWIIFEREKIVYRDDLKNDHFKLNGISIWIPYEGDATEERNIIKAELEEYVIVKLGLKYVELKNYVGRNYSGAYNNYELVVNINEATPATGIF